MLWRDSREVREWDDLCLIASITHGSLNIVRGNLLAQSQKQVMDTAGCGPKPVP